MVVQGFVRARISLVELRFWFSEAAHETTSVPCASVVAAVAAELFAPYWFPAPGVSGVPAEGMASAMLSSMMLY